MRRPPHVPEGQWGCQICFWTPVTKTVHTDEGDEEDRFFVLRMYTVFCVDQVEGKHLDHLRAGQAENGEPLTVDYQPAEDAIGATGASIRYGGGKAFYRRPTITSRCRQKPLSRAWTNSMAPASTNCAIGAEKPSVELEPQGKGEHLRPWRTRRRDRLLLLVPGVGRPGIGKPRKPHRLRWELAPGDAERSSLHLHSIGTSQQSG